MFYNLNFTFLSVGINVVDQPPALNSFFIYSICSFFYSAGLITSGT
jgi:hypothetical protein